MVDSPEYLLLTQLRAVRGDICDVQGSLVEIKWRLTNLSSGQASIIQHIGNLSAANAHRQFATDGLGERLVRLERYLEPRDADA